MPEFFWSLQSSFLQCLEVGSRVLSSVQVDGDDEFYEAGRKTEETEIRIVLEKEGEVRVGEFVRLESSTSPLYSSCQSFNQPTSTKIKKTYC